MKFQDDLGNTLHLQEVPKRIISVVPSLTELLYSLGLEKEVVGITKFCIHPESWYRNKPRVGGTKKLHLEKIRALNPDLIIASKEENTPSDIKELQKLFSVFVSDVQNYNQAIQNILKIGKITGKFNESQKIAQTIEAKFNSSNVDFKLKTVAYLIWKNPYMSIGNDTYIHSMLAKIRLRNIFSDKTRYPQTSVEELKKLQPDYIFLSSEPYPFKELNVAELQSELPHSKVVLVDGEMFSWYGSRMMLAADYFRQLYTNIF